VKRKVVKETELLFATFI